MELAPPKETINADELMAQYKQTKDLHIRNQLVLHYAPTVRHTIINMRSILPQQIQQEEFFNQGILALMECIERYDTERGASFSTYLYKNLRGAMLTYMRKQCWLPYRVRTARRGILQARSELSGQLLREPTDKEVAAHLQMPEKELSRNLQEIAGADMLSFEELIEGAGTGAFRGKTTDAAAGDTAPGADEGGVDSELLREELIQVLGRAVDQLSAKEKQVVTLCYYENLNLREIGEVLGVSQQRVSFIRSAALVKLQKTMSQYLYGKDEDDD